MTIYSERKKNNPNYTEHWKSPTAFTSNYSEIWLLYPLPVPISLGWLIFLIVPPLSISKLFLEKIFLQLQNFCRIFAKFCRKATSLFLLCPQLLRWWWKWCWHEFRLDSLLAAGHWSALRDWPFSPLGEIGQWVPLSLSLLENEIKVHCRSDSGYFFFFGSSQTSPWPSQQKFCCPRIFAFQVLLSPSLNCEKWSPGQKRHSQEICTDPEIKMRLQRLPNIQSGGFSSPSLGKGPQ